MRPREVLVLALLALIWGASFLFIRVAVIEMGPFALVAARLGLAALTLLPVALVRPKLMAGWHRYIGALFAVGILNAALPYFLFGYGEQIVPSGQASIMNATTPLFAVMLTAALPGIAHERLTRTRGLGVLLSFAGVIVLVGPNAFAGSGTLLAYIACLSAAISYAVAGVVARITLRGAPLLVQALGVDAAGFIVIAPIAVATGLPNHLPSVAALASIATLAILGTAIAYLLYYYLIRNVGVTRTAIVTYLLPCTALVWGALLLHEALTFNIFIGLALVLLGIAIINNVFARRSAREPAPVPATVESSE